MTMAGARSGAVLKAAGTLNRPYAISQPEQSRRIRLLLEIGVIFILAPLLMRYAIFTWRIPLFVVLQPVLFGFVAFLLWDDTFKLRRELTVGIDARTLVSIAALFALVAAAVTLWVKYEIAHRFMALPQNAPRLWLMIMIFYPLLSVIPQELVYRTFFFHRYGPLFGDARWLAILVNGLLFGFAHVIFGSYVSVLLTAFLGCLLAWRYDATRSFWAVWLEHSLYGCLVFTVGLGHYFFTGVSRLP
jgi:membrane protease YdiL (CAAX protease family)